MHHDVFLQTRGFLYMRVLQEKRESYAVHFVPVNQHATVLSHIHVCRTSYTIFHKISQFTHFFLIFANFGRGVY